MPNSVVTVISSNAKRKPWLSEKYSSSWLKLASAMVSRICLMYCTLKYFRPASRWNTRSKTSGMMGSP